MEEHNHFRKRVHLSMIDKDALPSTWKKRYTRREHLRDGDSNQIVMLLDLIRCGFLNANDIAKGWHAAESKFWGGSTWKNLEKKRDTKKDEESSP